MSPALRRDLRRRSAIEPMIGHMKTDGRLMANTAIIRWVVRADH